MHQKQSHTTGIHVTIIVLPGGGIHTAGLLHAGPQPPEALIEDVCGPLRAAAVRQARPIRLSIGHPDGRVEHRHVAVDGTVHPGHTPCDETTAADPVWSQGIPEDTGLLEPVRAAERAGQWRAAQQAAHRATRHLIAQHGRDHPYAVMGIELQAHCALMAQDLAAGAALSTEAAVVMHRLGGPAAQYRRHLANAVAAWIRSGRDTRPGGAGFAVAHALIRITPDDQTALAALLRRLAQDRA